MADDPSRPPASRSCSRVAPPSSNTGLHRPTARLNERAVRATVAETRAASIAGDGKRVCAVLSSAIHEQIERETSIPCAKSTGDSLRQTPRPLRERLAAQKIVSVKITGDHAAVAFAPSRYVADRAPVQDLVREDGKWRIGRSDTLATAQDAATECIFGLVGDASTQSTWKTNVDDDRLVDYAERACDTAMTFPKQLSHRHWDAILNGVARQMLREGALTAAQEKLVLVEPQAP